MALSTGGRRGDGGRGDRRGAATAAAGTGGTAAARGGDKEETEPPAVKRRRPGGAAAQASAAASTAPTLGRLPAAALRAVCRHLLHGAAAAHGAEPWGSLDDDKESAEDHLVTADGWAAAAAAAATCRRFHAAFLAAVVGLDVAFGGGLSGGVAALPPAPPSAGGDGEAQAWATAGTALVAVLPKLPHLCSINVSAAAAVAGDPPEGTPRAPSWVVPLLFRRLLEAASAAPALREVRWAGAAVHPSALVALGRAPLERVALGAVAAVAGEPTPRDAAVGLLRGVAATLRVLRWTPPFAASVGLEGDGDVARLLKDLGRLPQLRRLVLCDDHVDRGPDAGGQRRVMPHFPRLTAAELGGSHGVGAWTVGSLCVFCPLDYLQLPPMRSPRATHFLSQMCQGIEPPSVVEFCGDLGLEGVPLPLWRLALYHTKELTMPWPRLSAHAASTGEEESSGGEASAGDGRPPIASVWAALAALPDLRRLTLSRARVTAEGAADVALWQLVSLKLVDPTFTAGAAGALVAALTERSPSLAELALVGWTGGAACGMSAAILLMCYLPALRALTLSMDEAIQDAENARAMEVALKALTRQRPAVEVQNVV